MLDETAAANEAVAEVAHPQRPDSLRIRSNGGCLPR